MNPTRQRPVITWAIIAINVVVYFFVQPQGSAQEAAEFTYEHAAIACEIVTGDPLDWQEIDRHCIDHPLGNAPFPDKNVWFAVVVSMFLHGGLAHLGFNMWSLWIFGNNVEEAFGRTGYLVFYLLAGLAATAGFVALNTDTTVPLVGASGAIAGVMGAYVVLFPRHHVMTLVFVRVVAIPALVFLGIWLVSQFLLAGGESGIAWEAHVAGFAFGALFCLPFREVLLRRTLSGSRTGGMVYVP